MNNSPETKGSVVEALERWANLDDCPRYPMVCECLPPCAICGFGEHTQQHTTGHPFSTNPPDATRREPLPRPSNMEIRNEVYQTALGELGDPDLAEGHLDPEDVNGLATNIADHILGYLNARVHQPDAQAADVIAKAFPTSWLDPLLTGPDAVLGKRPWGCPDVERLLAAVKERVLSALAASPVQQPDEVGRALNELEEMFPDKFVSVGRSGSLSPLRTKRFVLINVGANEQFRGTTLSECMASLREWAKEQNK